jgi:hypothetical protein
VVERECLLVDHEYVVGHQAVLGVSGKVWHAAGYLVATGGAKPYVPASVDV